MFHYIFSVRRKPNTDISDYQGLGTPTPIQLAIHCSSWVKILAQYTPDRQRLIH
jgi:hypothetical protein